MSFTSDIGRIANEANNRLSNAIEAEAEARREKENALAEQRQVMSALRAVLPDHYESTRGESLENRADGALIPYPGAAVQEESK